MPDALDAGRLARLLARLLARQWIEYFRMNISATNGLYLPATSLPATRPHVGKSTPERGDASLSPQTLVGGKPLTGKTGTLAATRTGQLRADQVRGRLVDNSGQNPVARQALSAYLNVEDQERREELKMLGIDVYA